RVVRVDYGVLDIPALSAVDVEGVANAKAEAGERRRDVRDHVVNTNRTHRSECLANGGLAERIAERAGDATEVGGSHVVLTTSLEGTPGVAFQTEPGFTTEHAARLSVVTG